MEGASKFDLKVSGEGGQLLVCLGGQIGYIESNKFQSQLDDLLSRDERVILFDCNELTFISSAGLRAILQFAKQAPAKEKKLGFCALQDNVAHVFDISGFTKILQIYPSREQALANLSD